MASTIVSVPPPLRDPGVPDENCLHPHMRYEVFRISSLSPLSRRPLPLGVHLTALAATFFFQTQETWIVCFYCGMHYGLGHHEDCKGELYNVPLALCWEKLQEARDAQQAAQAAETTGVLTLRACISVTGLDFNAPVQPSCGTFDMSDTRLAGSRLGRNSYMEEAGFFIVAKNAVRCASCGNTFTLDILTPLQQKTSLRYILERHAQLAPDCRFRN